MEQPEVKYFFYLETSLCFGAHLSLLVLSFSGVSDSNESVNNAGDPGSIPGLGRSPGEGSGNPLQYLSWKISWTEELGRLAHGTTKSCTRLSN